MKVSLEQAENMLTKPLLATNKDLFNKIVNSNLALHKKPGMYDAFIALLKELFPKQERLVSIPAMALGIMFAWFFMWNYVANTSLFVIDTEAATVANTKTSDISTNPATVTAVNPEEQMAMILSGQFWQQ